MIQGIVIFNGHFICVPSLSSRNSDDRCLWMRNQYSKMLNNPSASILVRVELSVDSDLEKPNAHISLLLAIEFPDKRTAI